MKEPWCETNIQKGADNEKLAQWNIPMDRFCIKSHKTVTPQRRDMPLACFQCADKLFERNMPKARALKK